MRGWLRRGAASARLAEDRGDLWAAGALAEVAGPGCLPLVLAVAPLPTVADLTILAARLGTAPSFPGNVVALAATALGALMLIRLAAAFGEASVLRALVRPKDAAGVGTTAADAGWIAAARLVSSLPAAAAVAALGLAVASVPVSTWIAPESGTPLVLRLGLTFAPLVILVALAALAGGAYAAAASRRLLDPRLSVGRALLAGARDVAVRPLRALALAAASAVLTVGYLVLSFALLVTLWRPIGAELASPRLEWAPAIPLLLGFVFIWLCLVAGSGGLHVWLSTWWTAELTDGRLPAMPALRRLRWMRPPKAS